MHMTSRIIFNADSKLKKAALAKARSQGIPLSAVLTIATRAFVNNNLAIDIIARDLSEARNSPLIPAAKAYRRLGLKK